MAGNGRRRRGPVPEGIDPDICAGPAYMALAKRMAAEREDAGPKPTADGTLLRASMAGNCTRAVAFQVLGVEPAVDIDTSTLITFDIGNAYHELIQASLADTYGAQLEVLASHKGGRYDMSGSADAVYGDPVKESVTCVEIKSMKSFAWNLAVEGNDFDHVGPGPKREHLTQAGIYALAPQILAEQVHMIYVNKDTGEMAEWIIGVHQPLIHLGAPFVTIAGLARAELDRLQQVVLDLQGGTFPERHIPGYGVVMVRPPEAGSKDKPWNCRFCSYQPICVRQIPDAFPLDDTPWHLPSTASA